MCCDFDDLVVCCFVKEFPMTKAYLQYENDLLRARLQDQDKQYQAKLDKLEAEVELLENKLMAANSQIRLFMTK